MIENKSQQLKELSEKLHFLINLNQDFTEYCRTELGKVCDIAEQCSNTSNPDEQTQLAVQAIKEGLNKQVELMEKESEQDIADLEEQREMIDSVNLLDDIEQKESLTELFLEDTESEKESLEEFKKRIMTQELEERKAFKSQVDDMKEAIKEGGILELEAFLDDWLQQQSEIKFQEAEEDEDAELEDIDEKEVEEVLNQMKEPYKVVPNKKS